MASILEKIVQRKKQEVASAMELVTADTVQGQARDAAPPRQFFSAVVEEGQAHLTRVIAEIKRKSPSAGVIREDFDPPTIARQYHDAGARAISCLTDEVDFGGDIEFIGLIRRAVELPVLRKDFIIDPYQVWESRVAGADAILLIAECLEMERLLECREIARQLGMTTLVEVHSQRNLDRVIESVQFGPGENTLLGINNRDLSRMVTEPSHTTQMLEAVDSNTLDRSFVVSESGIRTPEDLALLRASGVNIVLVGEHLMARTDPGSALEELLS